ncbi:6735_t:CDS:2 [Cetraspora pellucida]|uniref:6735_t:CDS:1 n=1 Tax=Cetraspora pellucida TaxID=1433469 RepID=A0A9N9HHV3_9GLOM|nr:6735_t:CDS:2 [Cetraspora pellucida]
MTLPLSINAIFDIEEEDMDISDGSDNEFDDVLDRMLDATNGAGQIWETVDDDNITEEGTSGTERSKTYNLHVEEYVEWIEGLEKSGLSYIKHDCQAQIGTRKKNQWSERWYCHRYGTYESTAGKDTMKKPRLVQKETKKCGCKSYITVTLPIGSIMTVYPSTRS